MIKRSYPIFFALSYLILSFSACVAGQRQQPVRTGAEILIEQYLPELKGKRIGLAMNPTARIGDTHMLDTLMSLDINVTALFAAEHGFRGESSDGAIIKDGVEPEYELPVYSLYGQTKTPTAEMLNEVDLIIFDMQDVGARFYTFYQSLFRILESAEDNGKTVWVLDRPNPAGGEYMDGWIMEPQFHSFIGAQPLPIAHGMTIGELASMAIGEEWIKVRNPATLKVIPMEGWKRSMMWTDTGLDWYPPSPNLPTAEHAYIYLGTALFEGTSVSEGRGTANPFLQFGSPSVQNKEAELDRIMRKHNLNYEWVNAEPEEIPGKALNPKFEGVQFRMIKIESISSGDTRPVELGLDLLIYFSKYDSTFTSREYLNNLAGTDLRSMLERGRIIWPEATALQAFRKTRMPYLLY